MNYLYAYGLNEMDIEEIKISTDEKTYSELTLFKNIVLENINFLKDFGIPNYAEVVIKYPEIFLRDGESFKNVLSKFDRDDLIQKVSKNPAVFKKMVEFVDNN